MKRVLLLTGLVFLFSLTAAGADPLQSSPAVPTPGLTTFLASLSNTVPLTPAPIQRTACDVSKDCPCGGGTVTIECSGEVSCMVRARSVVCDGVPTNCPPIGSCPP